MALNAVLRKIGRIVISVKIKNSGAFMLNKNLYKSIILIVVVFICFLTNSIVASAVTEQQSEGWIYTIEDNAVKITGYTGTETVLNIPSEIDGYPVYSITGLAGNNNITDVNIPEGIEGIEDNAFCSCKNLKTVNCPSTLLYIGIGAFENCIELSEVRFASEKLYVSDYAFYNTSAIVIEVKEIPDYNYCSFPSGTKFTKNPFNTFFYRLIVAYSISPSSIEMLRPLLVLILCFIVAILAYIIYRINIITKLLFGKDKNYNYEKYYNSFCRISGKVNEHNNNTYVYKNPKDNVLSFKKYFLIILICIFSLGVLMLLLALFFIGTDYMRTVIDNVIFAMFLTFILILLLLIILIFIVYKIWAYIWNKKTDSRNFRKKSSIRIRLCNKGGKRHE